jgi:hypothetical protein
MGCLFANLCLRVEHRVKTYPVVNPIIVMESMCKWFWCILIIERLVYLAEYKTIRFYFHVPCIIAIRHE